MIYVLPLGMKAKKVSGLTLHYYLHWGLSSCSVSQESVLELLA